MNRYIIIEANVKRNKEDILSILKRNLKVASTQRYDWNYENCPCGAARCWLAKYENSNSFVGSAALFPRKIIINGEPVYAEIAGDFAVDKKHRVYGPAIKLQREIQSRLRNTRFKFIYGVPNELSKTLFLRVGYQEIGEFKLFIKILKTKYIPKEYLSLSLRSKMLLRVINFLTSFKMFSLVIDIPIKIISKEKRYKKTFSYSVEMPEFFDDRFDAFWKKVSKQFNIIGERTSNFLNWRYKQSSFQEYKIFCILDDKKNIAGYIVYYFKDNMCHIVDMLFLTSENILDSLLAEFALYARANGMGAIVIRYLGNRLLEEKFKEFNFFRIKKIDMHLVIYSPNLSFESNLLDQKNWHFFTGDGDI